MKTVFVYNFSSPDCRPCATVKPVISLLNEEYGNDVTWVSVNTQNDTNNYKNTYQVTVVPTMVVTVKNEDGTEVIAGRHSGMDVSGYFRAVRAGLALASQQ